MARTGDEGIPEEVSEDTEFEPDEELGDAPAARALLKKLRTELKEARQKRDEYLAGWQRCKADSINARKELASDAERGAERQKTALISDLLPALDAFDMAAGSANWIEVGEGFRTGMEHVRNQLLDTLSRHGVSRYGKVGDPFDPRIHEAVEEIGDVAGEPHSIIRILRYGYRSGDRVIRPAQVIVKSA